MGACSCQSPDAVAPDAGDAASGDASSSGDATQGDAGDASSGDAEAGADGPTHGEGGADAADAAVDASTDADAGDAAVSDASGDAHDASDAGEGGALAACPTGAAPGTPASDTCSGTTPVITASGSYPLTLTGANANYTLPCSLGYPQRRDVVFALCVPHTQRLKAVLTPAQSTQTLSMWLTSACGGTGGSCIQTSTTNTLSVDRLTPGTYYLVVEGYADGNATLDVTLSADIRLATVDQCAAVATPLAQDGPLPIPGSFTTSPTTTFPGSNVAPSCVPQVTSQAIAPFSIASPAQATVLQRSNPGASLMSYSLRPQCATAASDYACVNGAPQMLTRLLDPGTYFVAVGGAGAPALLLEPPWPTATNVTCQTARTVPPPMGTLTEDRVVTPGDRYYSVTTTTSGLLVEVGIVDNVGDVTISVYSDCTNAATRLGQPGRASQPGVLGSVNLPGLPPGTYSIVASSIELGTRYFVSTF